MYEGMDWIPNTHTHTSDAFTQAWLVLAWAFSVGGPLTAYHLFPSNQDADVQKKLCDCLE
jgi:hypothetical protein